MPNPQYDYVHTWTCTLNRSSNDIGTQIQIEIGVNYMFSFVLGNGNVAQAAPTVAIEASGTTTFADQVPQNRIFRVRFWVRVSGCRFSVVIEAVYHLQGSSRRLLGLWFRG